MADLDFSKIKTIEQADAIIADAEKLVLALTAAEPLDKKTLRQKVRAYEAFYKLLFDRDLPSHARRFVIGLCAAEHLGKGVVEEAFRGSTKSTTITIAFTAFRVGHYPMDSNLLIQVGDEIADDNTQSIANIIAFSPAWKMVFPTIVPDEAHWAASGYYVKKTDMDYGVWIQTREAVTKDPTFLGVGYKSHSIIGKHPTGLLLVDDIHDENNTSSDREMRRVKVILTGTIFPAAQTAKIQAYIGTPWSESDALHYCLATGEFLHVKVPAEINGVPSWNANFPRERLDVERRKAGEIEYARMYLLDLSKTKGLVLRKTDLDFFDHTAIQEGWETLIGIDYTSVADPRKQSGDYFALAVGKMIPGLHKLVIVDGIRERLTQADAETAVVGEAFNHSHLTRLGVEAIITGDEFLKVLMRSDLLKNGIIPEPLRGGPYSKSKGYRYEKIMQPAFAKKQVLLSDAENPFLQIFVEEWMNWQGDALEKMHHNDTLDAVFNIVWMAMPNFARRIGELEGQITNPMWARAEQDNPYAGIAASLGR